MSKTKDITDPAQAQTAAWRLANGAVIGDLRMEFHCSYYMLRKHIEPHLPEGAWRKFAKRNLGVLPGRISAGHRRRRQLRDAQTPNLLVEEVRRATARRLLGWLCSGCGWSPSSTGVSPVGKKTRAGTPVLPERCPKCGAYAFEEILGASPVKDAAEDTAQHLMTA